MTAMTLIERFRGARADPTLAVLEGFHALKHALRFGAELIDARSRDKAAVERLCEQLAPDLTATLTDIVDQVPADCFAQLAPRAPRTGVLALARRPSVDATAVLRDPGDAPLVLLENPTQHGNIGAVIRVAAAVSAAGVLTLGGVDPWHPAALRGAAGLHFALSVARLTELPEHDRPLLALALGGQPLAGPLPARALLAFGNEREGLSESLLAAAGQRLTLPMRSGISSLNLATSVAAVLYLGGHKSAAATATPL